MRQGYWWALAAVLALASPVGAEQAALDLPKLAKEARPAVMLLVVYDKDGEEIGTGTGFLVSSDGKLVTNYHVIVDGAKIVAKTASGGLLPVAGVLAQAPKDDLVLLKVKGRNLPALKLGSAEKIEIGMGIAVIGNPLGEEGVLSEGIVSAVRDIPFLGRRGLQITAAVVPGSSGSPVLDGNGEVVGVVTCITSLGRDPWRNFAVPAEAVKKLVAEGEKNNQIEKLGKQAGRKEDGIWGDVNLFRISRAQLTEDWAGMLKCARELVKRYPKSELSYWFLGVACDNLKRPEEAITAYKQAIKIKPDFAMAWYSLSVVYKETGRPYDEVIAACQQATKIDPDHEGAWNNLGCAYQAVGKVDEAVAACKQAIKIKADFVEAWYNLGISYGMGGQFHKAIAAYKQAIEIKPDHEAAWYNLGIVSGRAGQFNEAIAAYRQAIGIQPDYVDAWNNLGSAYGRAGQFNEAIAAYKEAIRIKPDYTEVWNNLGIAYGRAGQLNEAIAAFREAIRIRPDYADAWYDLGFAYVLSGQKEKASEVLQTLKKLDPAQAAKLEGLLRGMK